MKNLLAIILTLSCFYGSSQDLIILKTGSEIKGKVIKVGVSEIEYKKDNAGPMYEVKKSEVIVIKYENGTKESFANSESISNKQSSIPEQGSKVFIESDNSKEERVQPHLTDRIEKWGYWTVVNTKDASDFIIEQVVKPKGAGVKGFVILKTKDGKEITHSKTIKASNGPGNGFSAWRGFSIGIGRWLKERK